MEVVPVYKIYGLAQKRCMWGSQISWENWGIGGLKLIVVCQSPGFLFVFCWHNSPSRLTLGLQQLGNGL